MVSAKILNDSWNVAAGTQTVGQSGESVQSNGRGQHYRSVRHPLPKVTYPYGHCDLVIFDVLHYDPASSPLVQRATSTAKTASWLLNRGPGYRVKMATHKAQDIWSVALAIVNAFKEAGIKIPDEYDIEFVVLKPRASRYTGAGFKQEAVRS